MSRGNGPLLATVIKEIHISETRINDRIRVPEVRLVGPQGEQVGVVRIEDALRLAAEADLDLVEVAPQAKPPVCKLMDYGKFKYEAAVKAREARKNQTNTVLKEVRFRLKIDSHDYDTKTGHAKRFLSSGDKVKAMIQFRGREQQRPEMGIRLLEKFAEDVAEFGAVESAPRIDGRNMVMVIGPLKNKAEAKAEARRQASTAEPAPLTRKQQRAAKIEKMDTHKPAPSGQSVADAMPEGLKKMAAAAQAPSIEDSVSQSPKAETPKAPVAPKTSTTAKATAPAAPKAPASAPKAPAKSAKPAAAKAPASKSSAPKTAPKPASTAKPAAKPTASKPTATPKPSATAKPTPAKPADKPVPKTAAKSSAATTEKKATPKPASGTSKTTASKTPSAPKPTSRPKPGTTSSDSA